MSERLSPQREAEILKFRDQCHPVTGILAAGRVHHALDDLHTELVAARAERDTARERADLLRRPARLSATPAEIDRHLRRILAEDVYLRYQHAIGGRAVTEAADDVRTTDLPQDYVDIFDSGTQWAATLVDPKTGGGPYPSQLLCLQHGDFGPCPGAPHCAPHDDGRETTDASGGGQP
jgi:hypothetical protein